jgi:hypothetical protein
VGKNINVGGNMNITGLTTCSGILNGNKLNYTVDPNMETKIPTSAFGNIVILSGNLNLNDLCYARLPSYTTSQIANLTAAGGDMVYNTDLQTIQGYQFSPVSNVMGWVSWTVATYQ